MRTAVARISFAFLVVSAVAHASPARAQELVADIAPLQPIRLSAASLPSEFLRPLADVRQLRPIVPRTERESRRPEALLPLYASLVTLQGLDIHSTRRAIEAGSGREANPAMRGVVNNGAAFIAVKAGATAGVIWASEKMWKKNRKGAVIFAGIVNAAMAAIVANNYRRGRDR